MTTRTKNVLIWAGVAVTVILVIGVVKKASKKISVNAAVTPSPVTLPQNPLGSGPNMNNWDGADGYSYTLSDGSDDYYTKNGRYVSSD